MLLFFCLLVMAAMDIRFMLEAGTETTLKSRMGRSLETFVTIHLSTMYVSKQNRRMGSGFLACILPKFFYKICTEKYFLKKYFSRKYVSQNF